MKRTAPPCNANRNALRGQNPLTLLLFLLALSAQASENHSSEKHASSATENKLLSSFIFNISKFTESKRIPQNKSPGAKIRFAVVDNEPLAEELTTLTSGKKVNGYELEVHALTAERIDRNAGEIVVLIPKFTRSVNSTIKKLKGCQCLTVTYEEGMALEGAIINFFTQDDHLRFEVNLTRSKEEGLEFSSQLLKLGKLIE